jgi:hypothetical protein
MLTLPDAVKKFSTFYGTRTLVTVFSTDQHLSLFWAKWILSMPSNPISLRSITVLHFHLRLSHLSGLFSLKFPHQAACVFLHSAIRTTCNVHHTLLDLITPKTGEAYKSWNSSLCNFLCLFLFHTLKSKYLTQHPIPEHTYPTLFPQCDW